MQINYKEFPIFAHDDETLAAGVKKDILRQQEMGIAKNNILRKLSDYSENPAPITVMSQVMRDYLHSTEIDRLLAAAKNFPRHGLRNYLIVLLAYRHALRISEVIDVRLADIDLDSGRLYCRRLKGSTANTHPMEGDEIRAVRRWIKERPQTALEFLFVSERGSPLTRQSAWRIVAEAGKIAGLEMAIHPHMLKHSCGYYLANKGYDTRLIQDYMGHKQIQNTVRYTQTNAKRFEGMWR